jgi:hypothetical protein
MRCLTLGSLAVACVIGSGTTALAQESTLGAVTIVLVEGSLEPGAASELPPAAQKALDDMKDFLPFKSFRLVDGASMVNVPGFVRERFDSTIRLRGSTYDYEIATSAKAEQSRVQLQFVLRQLGSELTPEGREGAERITQDLRNALRAELERHRGLEAQMTVLADRLGDRHPDMERQRQLIKQSASRIRSLEARIQEAARGPFMTRTTEPVTLIDTILTMRLGETVAVGTSRLGGGKALIALVTALPPTRRF